MSGGSYNYICFKIEEFADDIENQDKNPKRKAFSVLLKKIAYVAHEIEWADSCDISQEAADKAIDDFFMYISVDGGAVTDADFGIVERTVE